MLLLQSELVPWSQIALFGPTVVILAMLLWFLLKALPTWRELKLKEFETRESEAKAKGEQATALKSLGDSLGGLGQALGGMGQALGGLGVALSKNSDVLASVAIEQRRATDAVRLLLRVKTQSTEHLTASVEDLTARLADIEGHHVDNH
jgi:methyl-accepting chemotaxis protein